MKICKSCKDIKDESEFYISSRSKDGLRSDCKICEKVMVKNWTVENLERNRRYQKEWRDNNKEYISRMSKSISSIESKRKWREKNVKYNNVYYLENKEKMKESKKEYSKKWRNENKEYMREYSKKWREIKKNELKNNYLKNKDKLNKKRQEKRKNDIIYKLYHSIGSSIRSSIKRNGYTKKSRTYEILGCQFEEFKIYLESKFELWMTWENRGLYNSEYNYGWDLDHIVPISSAKTEGDVYKLNHYTNFQPLCSKVNRDIKINKLYYTIE